MNQITIKSIYTALEAGLPMLSCESAIAHEGILIFCIPQWDASKSKYSHLVVTAGLPFIREITPIARQNPYQCPYYSPSFHAFNITGNCLWWRVKESRNIDSHIDSR